MRSRHARTGVRNSRWSGSPLLALALPTLLACGGPGSSPSPAPVPAVGPIPPVVVDGAADEWTGVSPAWERPAPPAPPTPGDRPPLPTALQMQTDGRFLYLLIQLDREVNLQSMAGSLRLALDRDGDPGTGETTGEMEGADLLVDFSHRPEGAPGPSGQGIMVRESGEAAWEHAYGVELLYAPTWASTRFEVRVALPEPGGEAGSGMGSPLRLRLAALDPSGSEVAATPVLEQPRSIGGGPPHRGTLEEVRRAPGAHLRVVTWNVGDQGMMRRPEPYLRQLAALAPDLLLLDELNPAMDGPWLLEALGHLPGEGEWQVVVGSGGGRQRTAVAARLPITLHPELARVPWPDSVGRLTGLPMSNQMRSDLATAAMDDLPTVGATAVVEGRTILFVPLDLMCCGRAGGPEDRARIMAVESLRSAVGAALAPGEIHGVVVGGDLNLVGSREPLDRLRGGLDPSGGALVSAPTPRLDRASTMTWRSPGPFPPGQLDHVLVSGSSLEILRSFAFDPADLEDAALEGLGLRRDDGEVTDHTPLVVDLRIRR